MRGDLPGLKAIEVCVFGGNNCNGGANDGIYGGNRSDIFVLTMEGQFGQSVTLDPFGFRDQMSNGSFVFACNTPVNGSATTDQLTCGTPPPSNKVSEPGILALLAAVGIAGSVGRRRARACAAPAV